MRPSALDPEWHAKPPFQGFGCPIRVIASRRGARKLRRQVLRAHCGKGGTTVARIWRFVDFRLALVAAVLVAVLVPPAASAGSLLGLDNNCGATSQPFAQFGDSRNYTFGTNGGLENGAT